MKMNNLIKSLIIFIICFSLILPTWATELESLKDELEENEAAQEEVEKTIEEYEEEIASLNEEISDLETELEEEYKLMQLRIQAFYENFGDSFWATLLEEGSISELVSDIGVSIDLTSYDREQLDEIAALSEELETKQENMLNLLDEIYLEQEKLIEEGKELEEEYAAALKEANAIDYDVDDLTLLASLIYCEAGGEIYEGKLAVACVVINRVNSSKYPNTLSGVIYQSGQFSPASSGRLATVIANGLATDSCYQAAEYVLSGNNPYPDFYSFRAGYVTVSHSYTQIGNQKFW